MSLCEFNECVPTLNLLRCLYLCILSTQAQRVDTIQDVRQKLLVSRNARQAANDASMDAESDSGDDSDNDMFDWRAKKISRKVSIVP